MDRLPQWNEHVLGVSAWSNSITSKASGPLELIDGWPYGPKDAHNQKNRKTQNLFSDDVFA
jgi:hypothetical protein